MISRRNLMRAGCVAWLAATASAQAHDFRAGDLVVDHPYATPTLSGSPHGALYIRGVRNTGAQADQLLSASTAVAESVEIHQMQLTAAGVMQMREVSALPLPAGQTVVLKHGGASSWHLMLKNLKAPLKEGQRFSITLRFAKAGPCDVVAWVQAPHQGDREPAAHIHDHAH